MILITQEKFLEIHKKGYYLDIIYLLQLIEQQEDISLLKENIKIVALFSVLIRKNLISEDYIITNSGKELLDFIKNKDVVKLVKTKPSEDYFNQWWEEFPKSNKFEYKNKSFLPTRSFTAKKPGCKLLFNKIVNEGKYTAQQLIDALKLDVQIKKEESYKTGKNQLTFLQNTHTWLSAEIYKGYVTLLKENKLDIIENYEFEA